MRDLPPLDEEQRTFLMRLYAAFHAASAWPLANELKRQLVQRNELAVWRAGERLSADYILRNATSDGGIALRLPGLAAVASDSEEATDFIAVLRIAAERYRTPDAPQRIDVIELERLGLKDQRLERFNRFFEKSEFVLGPQIGGETGPHYDISNDIDRYLDVTNLEEFVRVQRARDAADEDDSGQQVRPRIDRAADEPSIFGIWRPDAIRVFISHTSEHGACRSQPISGSSRH